MDLVSRHELVEEAEDLVLDLADRDPSDKEAIVKAVAKFLDAIVPLDTLIPGPIGQLAEKADEAIFTKMIQTLASVFHVDPIKKAERKLRRKQRRKERKQRREEERRAQETGHA